MKLAPLNPTFLQERDAILAAAQANGNASEAAANVADVWTGFSIRGMGFQRENQRAFTGKCYGSVRFAECASNT